MANYDELITILKELLLNRFAPKPNYVRGLLGDGQGNVVIEDRPDYCLVRPNRGSTKTFEIFNKEVNPVDGWPILIGEFPWQPGLTQVVGTDWSAYEQTGWGESVANVPPHAPTHEWPDGLPGSDPMNVYPRALTPGRAYVLTTGSTTIFVNQFEYEYKNTGTFWAGYPGISLAGVSSGMLTGTALLMGIYFDPDTGALASVSGSTVPYSQAIDPPRPQFPAGVIPISYMKTYAYQPGYSENDFRDARRWLSAEQASGPAGGDLTGMYPDPRVAGLFGYSLLNTAPQPGQFLIFTGSAWQPTDLSVAAGGGGVWPEPGKVKIGITEYATIAAAISAASSGDTILVGVGTYTCDDQTIPNGVTLQGTNKFDSILRTTSGNYVLLSPTSGSCWVLDCTIDNQNTSGTTLGAFAANNPSTVVLENCILQSTASGGTNRRGLDSYTSTITARNCEFYASGGTTNVAVHTLNASATTITLKDCLANGSTYDIYHQTAFGAADLEGTELINNTLGTLGTYQGWYYYNNLAYLLASDGTIYTPIAPKSNANDILRYESLSSLDFVATINGTPSGTSVVYNAPSSGDENNIHPLSSSQNCKMVLHNTTRGDSALISDVDLGTNTITLTATVPGAWANGDTITMRSQVNTGTPLGGAIYFCDFEWVSATHQGFVGYQNLRDTGGAGVVGVHPYETFNASKAQFYRTQGASLIFESSYLVGLDAANKRFCMTWSATGSNTLRLILRQSGEN